MIKKTLWITFWVTLTLWLGGVTGCAGPEGDQNYKLLEGEKTDVGTTDHARRGEAEGVVYVYDEQPMTEAEAADDVAAVQTPTLDRSHWPKVYITATAQGVLHDPVYFHDLETYKPTEWVVYPVTNEKYLDAALGEVENDGWSANNMLDVIAQPAKFIVDIPLLIPKLFIDPPNEKNMTP